MKTIPEARMVVTRIHGRAAARQGLLAGTALMAASSQGEAPGKLIVMLQSANALLRDRRVSTTRCTL
jgi:hypothetical protein